MIATSGAFTVGAVSIGQGTIIATGLILGIITVITYRIKTRNRRYKASGGR